MTLWPPTLLCKVHDRIVRERPAGDAATRALWLLRLLSPILWFLPANNITIRHHLIVAGLLVEVGKPGWGRHASRAMTLFHRLTSGPGGVTYPYLEGWSYLVYIEDAVAYWTGSQGPDREWEDLLTEQQELHRCLALPTRHVVAQETYETARLFPDDARVTMHPAFTVTRKDGQTTIVHHDPRLRLWSVRTNLHVSMTYGKAVRTASDWTWYKGWPKKRLRGDLWWRLFPPRMELVSRNASRVVMQVGKERKSIVL